MTFKEYVDMMRKEAEENEPYIRKRKNYPLVSEMEVNVSSKSKKKNKGKKLENFDV